MALRPSRRPPKGEADELRGKLAATSERAATAEARAGELRTELDHAHQEACQARAERDKAQEGHGQRRPGGGALWADLAVANSRTAEIERRAGELRADRSGRTRRPTRRAPLRPSSGRPPRWPPPSATRCARSW